MFYRPRSLWQILAEGTGLYVKHFWPLTRPFAFAILMQLIGIFLWLFLAYQSVNWTGHFSVGFRWIVFMAANLPGLALFMWGFWHYMIWFSALNLVIRDLIEQSPLLENMGYTLRITSRSVEYSLVWIFLFALLFIPIGLAFIPIAMSAGNTSLMGVMLLTAATLLLVGLVVGLVLTLLCAMVFQVFVFTPGSAGACLFRSADLVRLKPGKVLLVSLVALLLTQNILPAAVTAIFDGLHVSVWLSQTGFSTITLVLQASAKSALMMPEQYPPYMVAFYRYIFEHPEQAVLGSVRTFVYAISCGLWIPLSTCWFTLLYADLKATMDARKHEQTMVLTPAGEAIAAPE